MDGDDRRTELLHQELKEMSLAIGSTYRYLHRSLLPKNLV
jgi:hypothetical protein